MSIKRETAAFPVGKKLVSILTNRLAEVGDFPHASLIVHFRDPKYTAENGGYRPVEIRIGKDGYIQYITEFSYVGLGYLAELAKSSDFDFSQGLYQNEYRLYPINSKGVEEFYRLWESNFCSYIEAGVFNVQVSRECE